MIELNKVLGDGVTSKVGGACSRRPGTPGDLKGPWEPNEGTIWWTLTGRNPGADSTLHTTQQRCEGGDKKKKGCTEQQDQECLLQPVTYPTPETSAVMVKDGSPLAAECERRTAQVREEVPPQKERAIAPAGRCDESPIEGRQGPGDEVMFSSSEASAAEGCGGMRRHPEGDPHTSGCEGSKPYMHRAGLGKRDPGNGAEVEATVQEEVVEGLDLPMSPSSISAGAPEGKGVCSKTTAASVPCERPMFSDGTSAGSRHTPRRRGASMARKSKESVEREGEQGRPAEEMADPVMREGLTRAGQEPPPQNGLQGDPPA